MTNPLIEALRPHLLLCAPTGSRVICDPPPTDTDEDWLVLCDPHQKCHFEDHLATLGFVRDGSPIKPADNGKYADKWFASYKFAETNIIAAETHEFFDRFMAATHVAKRLNLLHKPDRIALFQAVLYGRIWPTPPRSLDLITGEF